MRKNKWLALTLVTAMTASQLATAAYADTAGGAAPDPLNGTVRAYSDGVEAYSKDDGAAYYPEDNKVGSVNNEYGGRAVWATDRSNRSSEGSTADKTTLTVDGSITSNNSKRDSGSVSGLATEITYADVSGVEVEVSGSVTASNSENSSASYVTGVDSLVRNSNGGNQSVTITTGDVEAKNLSSWSSNTVGVQTDNYEQGLSLFATRNLLGNSAEETEEKPASPTITTTINTGNVTANSGAGGYAAGVDINSRSANANQEITVNVKGNVTASTSGGAFEEYDGSRMDAVGVSIQERSRYGYRSDPSLKTDATVAVAGNVKATAGNGSAAAVIVSTDNTVLVGGNATASGTKSTGIMLTVPTGGINPDEYEAGRIEVLGTVDGGKNGSDLLLSFVNPNNGNQEETEAGGTTAELTDKEKAMVEGAKEFGETIIPVIVTHELANGTVNATVDISNSAVNAAAEEELSKALQDKVLYTVNYTKTVKDESGKEDDSLGSIDITKYDGLELASKELQTNGETAYVAKAGDMIKISIKVNKESSSTNKESTVEGDSTVTTERKNGKLITTTRTPVTTTTWTETTSYVIDSLTIKDENGYDCVAKLEKEINTNGEKSYSLVITPFGGVDIDVETLIKAITEKSNLQELTKEVVSTVEEDIPSESRKSTGSGSSESHTRMGYWRQDAKGWYFQFLGGGYAKNAVINIDAYSSGGYTPGWYGFGDDGYMKTGWALINGNWYYFDQNGLMRTGWSNINGKDYYFNPGVFSTGSMRLPVGALYVNTTTPDGQRVDENGAKI